MLACKGTYENMNEEALEEEEDDEDEDEEDVKAPGAPKDGVRQSPNSRVMSTA